MSKPETKDVYQMKKINPSLWERWTKEKEATGDSLNNIAKKALDAYLPKLKK